MAYPREPCPSAWMLNQSAFVLDPVHLWMAARKKKLTHPLSEAGHSRGYLQNVWPFYFTSSSPPPLYAIKETGIQTPIRWLFWDISLPSSLSASFPNKVVFPASTPCLRFIGLSCSEQNKLGLGKNIAITEYPHVKELSWNLPHIIYKNELEMVYKPINLNLRSTTIKLSEWFLSHDTKQKNKKKKVKLDNKTKIFCVA